VSGIWILVLVIALAGICLLVRALRDVRHEISSTVDSFTEFRTALAPALVTLRDETRDVTLRLEPAPGTDPTRR
jgi:hypothetical protein